MNSLSREFKIQARQTKDGHMALAIVDNENITYGGTGVLNRAKANKLLEIVTEAYSAGLEAKEPNGFKTDTKISQYVIKGTKTGKIYAGLGMNPIFGIGDQLRLKNLKETIEFSYSAGKKDRTSAPGPF